MERLLTFSHLHVEMQLQSLDRPYHRYLQLLATVRQLNYENVV